ncbi:MAG: protein kinase [Xanthomonadales bacterium]|nr:protein kinase [Xanthomonadales bacterium]
MNITGYRIVRTLGRGGMATVYLAEQQSVQREVALKVMSTTLLGDEQFGERFLREARIAARLSHPNVVQIFDVGICGEYHYIAMEYVPGGAVMGRSNQARTPGFALSVTSQIASALDYAGSHNIVHRDIKPDNILLRADGTAVLTDFGIARAADASRMTRTGAVIGTPHYMSPEQARGQTLDGRADLYSLGIVLYELLVGHAPYQAEDSMAVGIMQITAPVPKLPSKLASLQPLLDRMLAKDPAQRYQSGAEVMAAISALQRDGNLSRETRVLPSTNTPANDLGSASDAYAEPRLGAIDTVLRAPTRIRTPVARKPRRLRWLALLSVLLLAAIGAGLYHFQDRLRDSLPQTRLNQTLEQADAALRAGQLSGSDGSARELYLVARAIDPDNETARQGLQAVGRQLLAQARTALAHGDATPANALLTQAESLMLPAADVADLARNLQLRESKEQELGTLLDAARRAADQGQLDGNEQSALSLYRRVLSTNPGNAIALAGQRDVLSRLLQDATTRAMAGDFEAANTLIERVAAVDPAHLGLPDARAALAKAKQARSDDIAHKLDAADALLARHQLVPPPTPNALEAYRAVLAIDPGQTRALEGIRKIAGALVLKARRLVADYRFDEAQALIDQARDLAKDLPGLTGAIQQLHEVRERRTQFTARQAARQIDLPTTLQHARDALRAGQFLVPPGESAYDLYRAVLSQSPDNAEARAGLAALPDRAMERFNMALAANRLGAARDALEAVSVVSPTDARLLPARQQLARSYLAYASERLGAGELERASAALNRARELDPDNAELPAMQARLEQARGH